MGAGQGAGPLAVGGGCGGNPHGPARAQVRRQGAGKSGKNIKAIKGFLPYEGLDLSLGSLDIRMGLSGAACNADMCITVHVLGRGAAGLIHVCGRSERTPLVICGTTDALGCTYGGTGWAGGRKELRAVFGHWEWEGVGVEHHYRAPGKARGVGCPRRE